MSVQFDLFRNAPLLILSVGVLAFLGSHDGKAESSVNPAQPVAAQSQSQDPQAAQSGAGAGRLSPEKSIPNDKGPSGDKSTKPEEDDYSSTPFTEYGEFNEAEDEEAEQKFFQHGRFFGVSIGVGFQFLDGYRGTLWQGGFPTIDFKFHYWFDFNVALDLGLTSTSQYYEAGTISSLGHVDVNMLRLGVDIKYYFDTKELSAPISFANPYLLIGAGGYSKTENSVTAQSQDNDNSLGVCGGAGLEFAIAPRKTYFEFEAKIHLVSFKDTYVSRFSSAGIPNLTGNFYTLTGNLLFTW